MIKEFNNRALSIFLHTGGAFSYLLNKDHVFYPRLLHTYDRGKDVDYSELERQLKDLVINIDYKNMGVQLSGGVDSSLLVHLMREKDFVCYHTVFEDEKFNEREHALKVARFYKKTLKIVYADILWEIDHYDEIIRAIKLPVGAYGGVYQTFKRMANDGIKVVINALGLDEAMAGYPCHYNYYNRSKISFLPASNFMIYRSLVSKYGFPKAFFTKNFIPANINLKLLKENNPSRRWWSGLFSPYLTMKGWDAIQNYITDRMCDHYASIMQTMAREFDMKIIFPFINQKFFYYCNSISSHLRYNKAPIRKYMRDTQSIIMGEISTRGVPYKTKCGFGEKISSYVNNDKYFLLVESILEETKTFNKKWIVKALKSNDLVSKRILIQMAQFERLME